MKRRLWVCVILPASSLALAPRPAGPARQVEWLYYGGDPGGSRYSPLADINSENIQRLQVAWQWKHWETPLAEYGTTPGVFENTPL
jgi:quinoprotein glucose dehydrogenase